MVKHQRVSFFLIALTAVIVLSALWATTPFGIYQGRDLLRAQLVSNGKFIFFGPELSGGGFLPGGFYYYLLALPYALGLSWTGVWWLMIVLCGFSLALGFHWIRNLFSSQYGSLMLVFYASSQYFISGQKMFMNPSFLPAFVVAFAIALTRALEDRDLPNERRLKFLLFAFLLAGLLLQLHFTSIFLVVALVTLVCFGKHFGLGALPRKYIFMGLGLFLTCILPYFVWTFFREVGHTFGIDPQNISGKVTEAAPFLYRQLLFEIPHINSEILLRRLSHLLLFPQIISLVVSTILVKLFVSASPSEKSPENGDKSFPVLGCLTLASFIPCLYSVVAPWSYRYALIFCTLYPLWVTFQLVKLDTKFRVGATLWRNSLALVFTLLFALKNHFRDLPSLLSSFTPWHFVGCLCTITLYLWLNQKLRSLPSAMFVFLASMVLVNNFALHNTKEYEVPTIQEMRETARVIHQMTGWDYEQARLHLQLLNINYEIDLRHMETFVEPVTHPISQAVDGFLIGLEHQNAPPFEPSSPIDWLKNNRLARTVVSGIESGAIRLLPVVQKERMIIIPYVFRDQNEKIDLLHNHGFPYEFQKLKLLPLARSGATFSGELNNCSGSPDWCRIFIRAQELDGSIRVEITGVTLAQPTEWVVPQWTEGLLQPTVTVNCGSEAHEKPLAHSIGFTYDGKIWTQNHSLLAPFSMTFPHPCKTRKISGITLKMEGIEVATRGKYFTLGKKSLPLSLRN